MQKITKRANGSLRVQTVNDEPSMTQQHLKDSTSVTSILERYHKTGEFSHVNHAEARYGDFSQFSDLRDAIHRVKNAQSQFDAIPAQIRSKFNNDPAQLVEYLQNPSNDDEAITLGFKVRAPVQPQASNDDKTTIKAASAEPSP